MNEYYINDVIEESPDDSKFILLCAICESELTIGENPEFIIDWQGGNHITKIYMEPCKMCVDPTILRD